MFPRLCSRPTGRPLSSALHPVDWLRVPGGGDDLLDAAVGRVAGEHWPQVQSRRPCVEWALLVGSWLAFAESAVGPRVGRISAVPGRVTASAAACWAGRVRAAPPQLPVDPGGGGEPVDHAGQSGVSAACAAATAARVSATSRANCRRSAAASRAGPAGSACVAGRATPSATRAGRTGPSGGCAARRAEARAGRRPAPAAARRRAATAARERAAPAPTRRSRRRRHRRRRPHAPRRRKSTASSLVAPRPTGTCRRRGGRHRLRHVRRHLAMRVVPAAVPLLLPRGPGLGGGGGQDDDQPAGAERPGGEHVGEPVHAESRDKPTAPAAYRSRSRPCRTSRAPARRAGTRALRRSRRAGWRGRRGTRSHAPSPRARPIPAAGGPGPPRP